MAKNVSSYKRPDLEINPQNHAEINLNANDSVKMSARGPAWLIAFIAALTAITYLLDKLV
ncbi:MAG: hypothetical protein ACOYO0_02590 [Sandarakinorhabdus sp.]